MQYSLIYITSKEQEEAEKIANILLDEKLETILFCKSRTELFPQIEKTVRNNHPYKTPCILQIPIENGNPYFLE